MAQSVSRSFALPRALNDFTSKIRDFTVTADDGQTFVLVKALKQWMRETNTLYKLDNKSVTNTELLANAAYAAFTGASEEGGFLPLEPSTISRSEDKGCVIVFSILLDIEVGHLIDSFSRVDILDKTLPESLSELKKKLHSVPNLSSDEKIELAEKFYNRQWIFCPARFHLHMDKSFEDNRIIPICRKDEYNSGGTATVWQIVVQAEFVDEKLRGLLQHDEYASFTDKEYGACYTFALKTFKRRNFEDFDNEQKAFNGLNKNPGLIKRLGSYSHRTLLDSKHEITKNLLLEFGQFDLKLYFAYRTPPMIPTETIAFWETLFEVAEAVSGIHEFRHGGKEFNGWHADIKPENIIFVCDKFKLADPGFACFKKKSATPTAKVYGGTNTYGAPEVYSGEVHQTIDTWSLGCVFSLAASYVTLGWQGVSQFDALREKALSTILSTRGLNVDILLKSQGLRPGNKPKKLDCYHDGTVVLDEITAWHTLLKNAARTKDPTTVKVIDLVDQSMLLPHPRITSKNLCAELKRIIAEAKGSILATATSESPENFKRRGRLEHLLKEIDDEAESLEKGRQPGPFRPFSFGSRVLPSTLKQRINPVPLKTSYRTDTGLDSRFKSIGPQTNLAVPTIVTPDKSQNHQTVYLNSSPPDRYALPGSKTSESAKPSTTRSLPHHDSLGPTAKPHSPRRDASNRHNVPKQNAIQAREDIKRRREREPFGIKLPRRKPPTDE